MSFVILNLPKLTKSIFRMSPNGINQRTLSISSWLSQRLTQSSRLQQKEKLYLQKDQVPPHYELIYRAPMESYVAWSMHVSTLSASLIGAAALYQYTSNKPIVDPTVETTLIMHSEDIYYFACGFLAINAILRLVVSKFPLRIYKHDGKYLAVYHSQFPGAISRHHFKQGEVKEVSYILSPWNGATYKLGNKTSLILEDYFKTPSEFEKMCLEDTNVEKR